MSWRIRLPYRRAMAPATLSKPRLFEPFEHAVAGLLCAELPGKPRRVEKRRQLQRRVLLARGVLGPAQLSIGGRQHRPSHQLGVASEIAGEGAIGRLDRLAVPA